MSDSALKTISSYESAYTERATDILMSKSHAIDNTQFLSWEIVEPKESEPHLLSSFGAIKIKIKLQVKKPVTFCHHGITLRDNDNQLIWAWATDIPFLNAGIHEFFYRIPGLPLKPGIYTWSTSLYSEGTLLDSWHGYPYLTVATPPQANLTDDWTGILNLPCDFKIQNESMLEHSK